MNWKRIEEKVAPDAGEYYLRGNIGPFQIEIYPPWESDEEPEWYFCINSGSDDLMDDTAVSEAGAKSKALGWLTRHFRDWQDEIDTEMAQLRKEGDDV